ncbi:MAG: hypothetical protein RSG76_02385 [Anaerovoracaceae bacterium]
MSILIFTVGALGYGLMEILFRGFTHWSMLLTGGACTLTLYYLNQQFKDLPLIMKAVGATLVILFYEFCVGLVVNLWFGWYVWDYSTEPGNILGQICPTYCLLWLALCISVLLISKGLYYGYQRLKL